MFGHYRGWVSHGESCGEKSSLVEKSNDPVWVEGKAVRETLEKAAEDTYRTPNAGDLDLMAERGLVEGEVTSQAFHQIDGI